MEELYKVVRGAAGGGLISGGSFENCVSISMLMDRLE